VFSQAADHTSQTDEPRIMNWITDVGAVGQDYALTTTVLWCGIILAEPFVRCCGSWEYIY
jgi:hypothetical protein